MINQKIQQSDYIMGKEIEDSDMSKNFGLSSQEITNPGFLQSSSQEVNF